MSDLATDSLAENHTAVLEKDDKPEIDKVEQEDLELKHNELIEDRVDSNGSEYESVDSANSSADGNEEHSEGEFDDEHDDASEGSVTFEREEGDGQESAPNKKVDDDEDKKNPQYIPKRGTFYEHDDRTLEDENEEQEPAEKGDKQTKKNVWLEKKEHWSHDRFDDKQQAPKSRSELVAIYGYDIRNEDGPPRARRRRRYGRGPNKYTRTWEDEDAYKPAKPVKAPIKKLTKGKNEFPPLSNTARRGSSNSSEPDVVINNNSSEEPEVTYNEQPPPQPPSEIIVRSNNSSSQDVYYKSEQNTRVPHQRVGTGRVAKPKPEVKKEIQDSDYKGMTRTRQYRNSKYEQKVVPRGQYNQEAKEMPSNRSKQNNIQNLERDLNKLNIQDGGSAKINNNKQSNSRQSSVPPRLQAEHKATKRYSAIKRLRSLPETAAPPFAQQSPTYYTNEYNQPTSVAQQQQGLLPQPNSIHTPQVPQIPPQQLAPIPQPPVTATSILQAPPQYAPPFPPPPTAFLQPTVAASYIAQPPPPLLNYVSGQPQFTQPPPFQGYQHQQFNAVAQPAELYQCQGGTTYYSTQSQQLGQRALPLKRPKAAIPILPPPPQEPRGRGRHQMEPHEVGEELYENNGIENSNYEDSNFIVQ